MPLRSFVHAGYLSELKERIAKNIQLPGDAAPRPSTFRARAPLSPCSPLSLSALHSPAQQHPDFFFFLDSCFLDAVTFFEATLDGDPVPGAGATGSGEVVGAGAARPGVSVWGTAV